MAKRQKVTELKKEQEKSTKGSGKVLVDLVTKWQAGIAEYKRSSKTYEGEIKKFISTLRTDLKAQQAKFEVSYPYFDNIRNLNTSMKTQLQLLAKSIKVSLQEAIKTTDKQMEEK